MITRKNENWFRMLFIWRESVLPKVFPRLMILLLICMVIVYFKGTFFEFKIPLNPAPFTVFGIALALFLGFRNTASYDRFWEARKLWGALLNDTRSLARQAVTMSGYANTDDEINDFISYLIAFTYALKHQLRHTDATRDLVRLLKPATAKQLESAVFKPVMLISQMSAWVQHARMAGCIDTIIQAAFDQHLNSLSIIVGGCERIASTPIPFTYRILLHRTVYVFCFLLPFGFVDSLGWFTPVIVIFIAYTFVALEAIADEIEEPFGMEPNDLALNAMCGVIESTLLELAGKPVPEQPISQLNIIN
jgi:putative membrane protein